MECSSPSSSLNSLSIDRFRARRYPSSTTSYREKGKEGGFSSAIYLDDEAVDGFPRGRAEFRRKHAERKITNSVGGEAETESEENEEWAGSVARATTK